MNSVELNSIQHYSLNGQPPLVQVDLEQNYGVISSHIRGVFVAYMPIYSYMPCGLKASPGIKRKIEIINQNKKKLEELKITEKKEKALAVGKTILLTALVAGALLGLSWIPVAGPWVALILGSLTFGPYSLWLTTYLLYTFKKVPNLESWIQRETQKENKAISEKQKENQLLIQEGFNFYKKNKKNLNKSLNKKIEEFKKNKTTCFLPDYIEAQKELNDAYNFFMQFAPISPEPEPKLLETMSISLGNT